MRTSPDEYLGFVAAHRGRKTSFGARNCRRCDGQS
jgi:hypothetical protein